MKFLITGVNKGIGLALVKELAKNSNNFIYGTVRSLTKASDLLDLHLTNLKLLELDMADDLKKFETVFEEIDYIDVVIHNAGITYDRVVLPLEESLVEDFDETFKINTVSTFKMYKATLPYLYRHEGIQKRFIGVSTFLADPQAMALFGMGGGAYGVSKIGMNYLIKQIALENSKSQDPLKRDSMVFTINPGAVFTPMTESYATEHPEGFITVEECIQNILNTIFRSDLVSGRFYNTVDGEAYNF
ncbi:putative short-chain dehydrogenase/reductase Aacufp [[Candida] jaroonii]|uniref:Short-chain dehydrogenase/reductase Aacufp n=1 Tax=[Candida] jaroonii TaxID=467808 RepID=A0ACA9Y942_9ASCO|nr:putative short-chain dehydrogenase/reductase Aacufp [[Candida] jaroonii]